jgi:small subunit ribosomal protein S9
VFLLLTIRQAQGTAEASIEGAAPIMDSFGRVYATGRRKTSVARVWVSEGSGQFIVNRKPLIDYFEPLQREHIVEPFAITKTAGLFDVWCTVKGGGTSGMILMGFAV